MVLVVMATINKHGVNVVTVGSQQLCTNSAQLRARTHVTSEVTRDVTS